MLSTARSIVLQLEKTDKLLDTLSRNRFSLHCRCGGDSLRLAGMCGTVILLRVERVVALQFTLRGRVTHTRRGLKLLPLDRAFWWIRGLLSAAWNN